MEQQVFAQFVQSLTTELRNVSSSVTNTLRGETYLKNIRPLVCKEDGGYITWVENMNRYFSVVRVAEEDKCQAALLTTSGRVGQFVFRVLTESPQLTWDRLKVTLGEYYEIDSNPQGHFVELANIKQSSSEALQDYMQRVVRLANRAYAGIDTTAPVVRSQVMNFFIEGLRDRDIKMAVLKSESINLEAAYTAALMELRWKIRVDANSNCDHEPMEICYSRRRVPVEAMSTANRRNDRDRSKVIERDPGGNYRNNNSRNRGSYRGRGRTAILCWNCGKEGHIWRFCRNRISGNDRGPFARSPANGTKKYQRT